MSKNPSDSVDKYVSRFPAPVKKLLKQMRNTIKKAAPKAEQKISYGIPTFTLNGNLVHFAAFKNHIGFYPGAAGIASFKKALEKYKCSKGAVQFPLDKPLPLAIVTRIVKFRVKQNLNKA